MPALHTAYWITHTCGQCWQPLTEVRPGKYQCDHCASVGCAFGSRIEDDEIPMIDAVKACHDVARKIEKIG